MLLILFLVISLSLGQTCTFTNWNFTDTLTNGWTIGDSDPMPYIDGNNYLVLGDIGTTETMGNASVYQDFTVSGSCDQQLNISFAVCTKDNSVDNDQQYVTILDPSDGSVVSHVFATLLGFNQHFAEQWYMTSCNICNCAGVNLTSVGISPLRLELRVHQAGNLNSMNQTTPTAFIIKDVCLL